MSAGLLDFLGARDRELDAEERARKVRVEHQENLDRKARQELVASAGFKIVLYDVEEMVDEAAAADPSERLGILRVYNYLLRLAAEREDSE